MRWRSPQEISYRLRQEAANLLLAFRPPSLPPGTRGFRENLLPCGSDVAGRLRSTAFARHVEALAEDVLRGRHKLLGLTLDLDPARPPWREDIVHGKSTKPVYFRRVPYLNFDRAGDHKIIWELNRHQHFVLLAQAFLFTGNHKFLAAIEQQHQHWTGQNRFQFGINWTSALEVAFRALSWIWVWHLAGPSLSEAFRDSLAQGLYRHGCHLEHNLSIYFSPNTHLLGEAVALHALAVLFPGWPRAEEWKSLGGGWVERELHRQVEADGAHFERSTYYHVYALDFFLLHYLLAGRPEAFRPALERMAEFLHALQGPDGRIPLIGDDDGGRVFHPYGDPRGHGRDTLATCGILFGRPEWIRHRDDVPAQAAWWLGVDPVAVSAAPEPALRSRSFDSCGLHILVSDRIWATADAGGFGPFRAGHSHSDALSITVRSAEGTDLLVDAGTFLYVGDPDTRNWFRGSAAHNTLRVAGGDQAVPAGAFGWDGRPTVKVGEWVSNHRHDYLDASCRYAWAPFTHRRRLFLRKPDELWIIDEVSGPAGEWTVEQFWHPGVPVTLLASHAYRLGDGAELLLSAGTQVEFTQGGQHGWRSIALRQREAMPVLIVRTTTRFPWTAATLLRLSADGHTAPISVTREKDNEILSIGNERRLLVSTKGVPVLLHN